MTYGSSQAPMDALVGSRYKGRYEFAISVILHGLIEIALPGKSCQLYWETLLVPST